MTEVLPPPPLRMIINGVSGAGKGHLASEIILKHHRGKYSRIYYFSGSAKVDINLQPIVDYAEKHLGQDSKKDPVLYDSWDESILAEIMDRQAAIVEHLRRKKSKQKFYILIVCDDFASERATVRGSALSKLFLQGRHIWISTLVLVQHYRALGVQIRTNAQVLITFRERSMKNLEAILEENSALLGRGGRDILKKMYDKATSKPYGFLLMLLSEADPKKQFYGSFETRLVPT